jgi:hypothetical protein
VPRCRWCPDVGAPYIHVHACSIYKIYKCILHAHAACCVCMLCECAYMIYNNLIMINERDMIWDICYKIRWVRVTYTHIIVFAIQNTGLFHHSSRFPPFLPSHLYSSSSFLLGFGSMCVFEYYLMIMLSQREGGWERVCSMQTVRKIQNVDCGFFLHVIGDLALICFKRMTKKAKL